MQQGRLPMCCGKDYRRLSEEGKAQEQLYKRTVQIDTRECTLPLPLEQALFSSPPWDEQRMMQAKGELNNTKDKLNTLDIKVWGKHTSFTNRAGLVVPKLRDIIAPEMCTIAWAKMYEMLVFQDLLPSDSPAAATSSPGQPSDVLTMHLCEAPGAFICATNHFIKMERPAWNWDWRAVTLNPWYEGNDQGAMIDDDALIEATEQKWLFGRDFSGDIRKQSNIEDLWANCKQLSASMGVPGAIMVTADGSVDCQEDPNEQERHTAPLHYCELVTALGMLAPGGSFVLKAFTLFEHPSLCTLYLMGCLFDSIAVTKPSCSKPGNSETYIIGKSFRGASPELLSILLQHVSTEDVFRDKAMFDRKILGSGSFMQSAMMAAGGFAAVQREIIEENLELFGNFPKWKKSQLSEAKSMLAGQWLFDMGLAIPGQEKVMHPAHRLCQDRFLSGTDNNTSNAVAGGAKRKAEGTLEDRKRFYEQRRKTQAGAIGNMAPGPVGGGGGGALSTEAGPGSAGSDAGPKNEGQPNGPAPFQPNEKVAKMMGKMGHKEGTGLGRAGQGITQPIKNTGDSKLKKGLGYQGDDPGDPLHGLGGGGGQRPCTEALPDTALLTNDEPLEPQSQLEAQHGWRVVVQQKPAQLTRSKFLPEQSFLQLKAARYQAACKALELAKAGPTKQLCDGAAAPKEEDPEQPSKRQKLEPDASKSSEGTGSAVKHEEQGGEGQGLSVQLCPPPHTSAASTHAASSTGSTAHFSKAAMRDLSWLCAHDGAPCMAPAVSLTQGSGALSGIQSGAHSGISGFWKLAGLDIALDVFLQAAVQAASTNPSPQPHMTVLYLGLPAPSSTSHHKQEGGNSEAQSEVQGDGGAVEYALRCGGPPNMPRHVWILPNGPASAQPPILHQQPSIKQEGDLPQQPSLPAPSNPADQHKQQQQQQQQQQQGPVKAEADEAGVGSHHAQIKKEEVQPESKAEPGSSSAPSTPAVKPNDADGAAGSKHGAGQQQQGSLQAALQAAPQGSRISTVPWEYLHAGDSLGGEAEQQEPAWLSEGMMGSLMNEDSSVAVAAKVGRIHLAVGDLSSSSSSSSSTPLPRESQAETSGSRLTEAESTQGVMEVEQEPLYRMRLLWEAATSLRALVPGGCLVLRLRDCLTNFSASLLYVLHRCFAKVCIVKPFTSCAASSERMVVALGRLADGSSGADVLLAALNQEQQLQQQAQQQAAEKKEDGRKGSGQLEVGLFVPPHLLTQQPFLGYLFQRNVELARHEARSLVAASVRAGMGGAGPDEARAGPDQAAGPGAASERQGEDGVVKSEGGADGGDDEKLPGLGAAGLGTSGGGIGSAGGGIGSAGASAVLGNSTGAAKGGFVRGTGGEEGAQGGKLPSANRAQVLEFARQQLAQRLEEQVQEFQQLQLQQQQQQEEQQQQFSHSEGAAKPPNHHYPPPTKGFPPPKAAPAAQPHAPPPNPSRPQTDHLPQQQPQQQQQEAQQGGGSSPWMGELWVKSAKGSERVCKVSLHGRVLNRVTQVRIVEYKERALLEEFLQVSQPAHITALPSHADQKSLTGLCGYMAGHRGATLFQSTEKLAVAEFYRDHPNNTRQIVSKAYLAVPDAQQSISDGLFCWFMA